MKACYIPRPGSVCARAVAHLRSLPAGTEISTIELARAAEFDQKQAAAFLKPAVTAGLVTAYVPAGQKVARWSIGDGVALQVVPPLRRARTPAALAPSVFEVSPAQRYEREAPPGSFMDEWNRLRGGAS